MAALALDPTALTVFIHLLARGGQADSVCQLRDWTNLSEMPVYYAVQRLEKHGLVFTVRTKQRLGNCKTWRTEVHVSSFPPFPGE